MAGFGAELVVAASEVLDEGVSADDDACGPVGLEAAHGSEPRFQPRVIGLDPVVRMLGSVVLGVAAQLVDDAEQRQDRS